MIGTHLHFCQKLVTQLPYLGLKSKNSANAVFVLDCVDDQSTRYGAKDVL
jgi:hypothetical protein